MHGDSTGPQAAPAASRRGAVPRRGAVLAPCSSWRAALLALGLVACALLAAAPSALADGAAHTWATRVVIVPGVTLCNVERRAFYKDLRTRINAALPNVEVVMKRMPDCTRARRSYWLPFMHDELKIDNTTIIVGHSSGAVGAMRYAEDTAVAGIVLVAPCYTPMHYRKEKLSGWYDGEWQWDKIRNNSGFIMQFSSTDDVFIPWEEHQHVADNLHSELFKLRKGHFLIKKFPELADALIKKFQ
ncbi:hypothetical protein Rsub_08373 [Raphidocelis subcapitata]|uniref:Uncharacterized protein n=1 Tax=Raphidocelis subcapitata TaxID=307507 RepID=A0A2V0P6B9_9CHLO|nr:hypothetical protein Rsub_08373 [Raphidocelis subcapitata]|eukprot:GBF95411.1 hypothetical protein Rsub_08373 [Raphidocelis subcapitata]